MGVIRVRMAICAVFLAGLAGCGGGKTPVSPTKPKSDQKQTAQAAKARQVEPFSDEHRDPILHASPVTLPEKKPEPEPVFRPDDLRPEHDDKRLAELGIHRYESRRLVLYTDIDATMAKTLPPLIDQAYEALVEYFGPMPPDRARSEYQMTGYLIRDQKLFVETGMIPEDLPRFEHGRHRRNEFWMREQKFDYYTRHLLIHEVTHCFTTVMPDVEAPVWYMEGMAEHFGTHRINADGTVTFRVMPTSSEEFAGQGRITIIHNELSAGRGNSISKVLELDPKIFLTNEPYAWSWALCHFLDTHPRYQQRFRDLGHFLQRDAFGGQFFRAFRPDMRDLESEWQLFVRNLKYGYDTAAAAIEFRPGTQLTKQMPAHECQIDASRGWQSSGVIVEAGRTYEITASGRFELASSPKPWLSEPQGISFRYFDGRPLGLLLGCVRKETGNSDEDLSTMLRIETIGGGGKFEFPVTGTLYLRVNDDWSQLSDNRGKVLVKISE